MELTTQLYREEQCLSCEPKLCLYNKALIDYVFLQSSFPLGQKGITGLI